MTSELNGIQLSDYEIILKIKKGRFFLSIPDLRLIASGDSLEQAYQSLTEKKEAFLKELQEAGLTLPKQESASITGARSPQKFTASPLRDNSLRDNVLGFTIKILIGGIALITIGAVSIAKLEKIAEIQTTKATVALKKFKSLKKPGRTIERELIRAGNHKFDPERQKTIEKNIRALVKRWKPAVKEIQSLFEE